MTAVRQRLAGKLRARRTSGSLTLHQCPCGGIVSQLQRLVRRLSPSWNQFQGLGKARTNSNGTKVPPVGRQDSIDAPSFGNCSHGAINQTEVEPCKSCIQFHGSGDVGRKR